MSKKMKWVCAILAVVLLVSVPAFASNKTVSRDLTYRDIAISVDGNEISPVDAKGNSTEPFIMDDSTYLPIRAISEALGYDIEWDDTTSSIKVNTEPLASAHSTTLLVGTDRHETVNQWEDPTKPNQALTNNLTRILAVVKASGVEPGAMILAGDNTGSGRTNYPFRIADVETEVHQVFPGLDTYLTYGSHDIYAFTGEPTAVTTTNEETSEEETTWNFNYSYDGFLTGPKEMDGYYVYGVSMVQMQYATDEEAEAKNYAGLDLADPKGTCAQEAVESFKTWIASVDDNKPIVVATHMPLHYDRNDNLGAELWVNALNEAAEKHDILVVWGHNHSREEGFDKGSSMNASDKDRDFYLKTVGQTMIVQADNGVKVVDENGEAVLNDRGQEQFTYEPVELELKFTYANAGYIKLGYCSGITFTDFENDGVYDEMTIQRYSNYYYDGVTNKDYLGAHFANNSDESSYTTALRFATAK